MIKLLLINGPNLNLLGQREPSLYGVQTLETIESQLYKKAEKVGIKLETFQSNSEGSLVDQIQKAMGEIDAIMINAGAYTHTSIAIRDALLGVGIVYVEIHLSNTFSREQFRHHSFLSDRAVGVVSGFGIMSYHLALRGLVAHLRQPK